MNIFRPIDSRRLEREHRFDSVTSERQPKQRPRAAQPGLSASICETSRPRPAPSALRIAISFRRTDLA